MTTHLTNRIKISFNKAWKTYDDYCYVQKKSCSKLIELLAQQGLYYNKVADFACGTGVSTQHLIKHFNYEKIYAIDFSEKLLSIARKKIYTDNSEFILSDFNSILFPKNHLNLILSNMGLQWSINLEETLNIFNSYLSNSGILAFSIPMDGTFPELKRYYKNTNYRLHKLKKLLQQSKFELINVDTQIYTERFHSQIDAIKSLKAVGANCSMQENYRYTKSISRTSIKNLFTNPNDISLTYKIGLFIAKKKEAKL